MKRWTLPVVVGVWVAGCGFFDFPAPERAHEGHGGAGSGGTRPSGGMSGMSGSSGTGKGGEAGDSTNGGSGGESPEGGTGGSTSGAAGAGEGGTGGAGEGGTSGSSTGGTGGDAGGGAGPTEPVMTGLKLWLDATSLADGPLTTWPNRVAVDGEPDATQQGSTLRPVVATFDGRKGVQFDGTRFMTFGEGFENWDFGLTFFLVARFDAPLACTEILQVSNGQEMHDISFQTDVMQDDPGVFMFEVATENLPTGPDILGGLEPMLASVVVRPPDSAAIFINTIPGPTRSHAGFLPASTLRANNFLGSGLYANCDPFEGVLFELLLYNRGLSEANVALVSEYLQAKWGCCDG